MKKHVFASLILSLLFVNCKKNDDGDNFIPPTDVAVQNFMWQALNQWYFWQEDAPNLGDNRFATDEAYTAYLQSFSDPSDFFFNTCYKHDNIVSDAEAIDRFSFLAEDYKELVQSLSGISKSNGLEFQLFRFNNSDDVYGVVQYIVANSDASTKNIQRGDLFTGVNGQVLDINNFRELLFGDADTYTLNLADAADSTITPNGEEVTLTKQEGLVENPILTTKVLEVSGNRIGYIMYNRFTGSFNEELNDAFGTLKAVNVTDLVLDLRYNPGGSVESARLLSSMIYGTNTNELFIKKTVNEKAETAFRNTFGDGFVEEFFADRTGDGTPINSLNLTKVYIIATGSSASASELVINSLEPYINVIQVGEKTVGKNEFSITMVDKRDNSSLPYLYLNNTRDADINPDNQWAIQPLVGRNENADGFSDFTSGLVPDIELGENIENFGVLGDVNEPLLALAIQDITGNTSKTDFTVNMPMEIITSSRVFTPVKDNMYLEIKAE